MRLPGFLYRLTFESWAFSERRWRIRARLNPLRRWWLRRTHEHCCQFSVALFAFLAPRLELYGARTYGAPPGYPVDYAAPAAPGQPERLPGDTDFDAWDRDVLRAAAAFRDAASVEATEFREGWMDDDRLRDEIEWAMGWLARWHSAVWV